MAFDEEDLKAGLDNLNKLRKLGLDEDAATSLIHDKLFYLDRKGVDVSKHKGFFWMCVKKKALDAIKKKQRQAKYVNYDLDGVAASAEAPEVQNPKEFIHEHTGQLCNPIELKILTLRALGVSFENIASELDMSPGAVRQKHYLFRKRAERFRKQAG